MSKNKNELSSVLNDAFALLGASDDLLSIVSNKSLTMPELVKQIGDWSYNEVDKLKHEIFSKAGQISKEQKRVNKMKKDLTDRLHRLNHIEVEVVKP